MASHQTDVSKPRKPLRLWPGVVLAIAVAVGRFVLPAVSQDYMQYGIIGGVIGSLVVLLWWLLFSRAPWIERLGALVLMGGGIAGTRLILHESIRTGAMGMLFYILVIPGLAIAFVAWALATRNLPDATRRWTMVATILAACGFWTLLRTGGFSNEFEHDWAWRWSPTPEERLLATEKDAPPPPPAVAPPAVAEPPATTAGTPPAAAPSPVTAEKPEESPAPGTAGATAAPPAATATAPAPAEAKTAADWPGFRGPRRDGIIPGVQIRTDWSAAPPVQIWKRPVGPGWSSFAVQGDRLYTQEQRGEDEVVSCYKVSTGEPVWRHKDRARFWESNAGAGPRGTPTLANGRVYTFGGTGIVNALDAGTGAVYWSRNAAADTGAKTPGWGFASSPLVLGDTVIVAAAGYLVAYDTASGNPRWYGPKTGSGYSSPHRATIGGVEQVVFLNGAGAIGVSPTDGKVLWEHKWPGDAIVQPGLTPEGDVLIGSATGMNGNIGMRRVALTQGPDGWTVQERWTTTGIKPYFNDFVVHEGHAYGFDGNLLACVDLEDGARKWKGGRYGAGQLVLLPEQDLLLVLSEQGELALVRAAPDQFTEVAARVPAIEGKTWNHPVLAGDVLLARNAEEMAAFRLALAKR
jgi:outer membrane protein assembly factor BamB